jgi:protein-S-isoprenylcysteine O-methyltransferase Ste14
MTHTAMSEPLPEPPGLPERAQASPSTAQPHQPLARALHRAVLYLSRDLFGGPRPFRQSWVIDVHKGMTGPFVGLLMLAYANNTTAAWIYLALHGGYGLAWVVKDRTFPDRDWQVRITFGGALVTFLGLSLYWLLPFFLVSGILGGPPSPPLVAAAIAVYTVGLVLMLGSDAQKHFILRERSILVQDGFYRYVRHPNYLGEMLVYSGFALLVNHWLPWLILGVMWAVLFLPRMLAIDASLARYPDWPAYHARTGFLVPRLRRRTSRESH